jgi:hypothetical protein
MWKPEISCFCCKLSWFQYFSSPGTGSVLTLAIVVTLIDQIGQFMSEKPVHSRLRRLVDWINLTGAKMITLQDASRS